MSEPSVPECEGRLQLLNPSGEPPLKPDPENPQHQKQIKKAQQIPGALLWLSTRTRPDLSYGVSMAASVQTRDLRRELEVRLRHLLQYVSSHPHLGLHFPYPTSTYLSLETFTDASFAPCGAHSHQAFAILLKVGHSQHLLHWNSTRQKLVSQSSAEAELIAHVGGVHDEVTKKKRKIQMGEVEKSK